MANKTVINSTSINLNDAKKFIRSNVELQLRQLAAPRLYMVGAPGTGKSDLMREICQENGWGLAVRYISNMAIEELTGLPVAPKQGEETAWSKPEIFNFKNIEYVPDGYVEGVTPTILLLDDFHLCDRMMQKYMFQLLTYMSLNGYRLPKNTAIILAGNRNNDKAGAMPIPAPVCNRMMFVEVTSSADDWLNNFAIKNGIRNDVCTFISSKGDVFLSSTPIETNAWASPRSWTYLSYQMDEYEKSSGQMPIEDLRVLAAGLLGGEVANEFIMYRELFAKYNFVKYARMDWAQLKKFLTKEVEHSPTNVYAIVNAGVSWVLDVYRANGYDIGKKEVKDSVELFYKVMCHFLTIKNNNVTIKPLVIAGITYMHRVSELTTPAGKKNNSLMKYINTLMSNQRDYDWLFYECVMTVIGFKLDEEDVKKLEEIHKKAEKADIAV